MSSILPHILIFLSITLHLSVLSISYQCSLFEIILLFSFHTPYVNGLFNMFTLEHSKFSYIATFWGEFFSTGIYYFTTCISSNSFLRNPLAMLFKRSDGIKYTQLCQLNSLFNPDRLFGGMLSFCYFLQCMFIWPVGFRFSSHRPIEIPLCVFHSFFLAALRLIPLSLTLDKLVKLYLEVDLMYLVLTDRHECQFLILGIQNFLLLPI